MSTYGVLTGDLFISTVSLDSALTSEHDCIFKQIYSRSTTHIRSGHQYFSSCWRHWYFLLVGFCPLFLLPYIKVISFLIQCITTTWLIDPSACHSFLIFASLCHFYPLNFLTTKASVLFNKQSILSHSNLPTMQRNPVVSCCDILSKQIIYPYHTFGFFQSL